MTDTTPDPRAFPLPPGFHINDNGMVTLHRNQPPTKEEVAWMWNTSQAIRASMGLPPAQPRRRRHAN